MAAHEDRVQALMIGVGAAFDYEPGNIKRAPMWMQKHNLEWLYRLMRDPKRLFHRYLKTNVKYLLWTWRSGECGKKDKTIAKNTESCWPLEGRNRLQFPCPMCGIFYGFGAPTDNLILCRISEQIPAVRQIRIRRYRAFFSKPLPVAGAMV